MSAFLNSIRDKIRLKGYSYKTEQTYVKWAERYIRFHGLRHPKDMGAEQVEDTTSGKSKNFLDIKT